MNGLTEIAQRMLAVLEEAGDDNIFALANTVLPPIDDPREILEFKEALKVLVEKHFVVLKMENLFPRNPQAVPQQDALVMISDLAQWFRYDTTDQLWTLRTGELKQARRPVIHITDSGMTSAASILEQRGYHWWSRQRE